MHTDHTDLLPTWALLWNLFLVPSGNCNIQLQANRTWLHSGACEWCWGLFTYLPTRGVQHLQSVVLPRSHHLPVLTQTFVFQPTGMRNLELSWPLGKKRHLDFFCNSSLLPASGLPNSPHNVHVRKDFYLWLSSALTCKIGLKVPLAVLLWNVSKEWEESHIWRIYWEGPE